MTRVNSNKKTALANVNKIALAVQGTLLDVEIKECEFKAKQLNFGSKNYTFFYTTKLFSKYHFVFGSHYLTE